MGTKVSSTGNGDFTPAPAGIHRAVCISYVDIGTHESEYNGEKKLQNKVMLTWELPDELIEIDGQHKPRIVSKFYTKSLHEKATLRHDLAAWRTREFTKEELKEFDLDNILGKSCQVNVIHESKNGSIRAKVTAVLPLSKGMQKPEPSIKPWRYDITEDGYNFPEQLSDKMKELIKKSFEMSGTNDLPGNPYGMEPGGGLDDAETSEGLSDSIPF
jgi:hypothetical protein